MQLRVVTVFLLAVGGPLLFAGVVGLSQALVALGVPTEWATMLSGAGLLAGAVAGTGLIARRRLRR